MDKVSCKHLLIQCLTTKILLSLYQPSLHQQKRLSLLVQLNRNRYWISSLLILTLFWIGVKVLVAPTLWCPLDLFLQDWSNILDQDLHPKKEDFISATQSIVDIVPSSTNLGKSLPQSQNHHGFKDMTINILEFIKAPPRSPQAIPIRNRVERNWTHLLRCLAPHGLNMENPKELFAKTK